MRDKTAHHRFSQCYRSLGVLVNRNSVRVHILLNLSHLSLSRASVLSAMFVQMLFLVLSLLIIYLSTSGACPLNSVDLHSGCYCGIEIDGSNYIQCQAYTIDTVPKFSRSYLHEKLNLSKNFIRHLTAHSFQLLKVKRIYLEDNPIETVDKHSFDHALLNSLEELYISSTSAAQVEFLCHGHWNKLRILKLSGFNVQQFQFCFQKLHRLEKLIIENSSIDLLSSAVYQLPFLSELSLMHNRMTSLNFDNGTSSSSSSIRLLNLTSNQLRLLPSDLSQRMPHLTTLDLSHNAIEALPLVHQLTSLNINLSFNAMTYVQLTSNPHRIDLSSNPICTLERTTDVFNLSMGHLTHLHCDCRLAFFLEKNLTDPSVLVNSDRGFANGTLCATPALVKGQALQDLTYEQLLETCSPELPEHCQEISDFQEVQAYADQLRRKTRPMKNSTAKTVIETAAKLSTEMDETSLFSSFRLTSFETIYADNDLLVSWSFDPNSLFNDPLKIQFQIIIEQELLSRMEIIRRTNFISPFLKQYTLHHLPAKRNYQVCLLLTRTSYGTDKYCREAAGASNETVSQHFSVNRSILCGFLVGTIVTTCLLVIFASIYHLYLKLKSRRKAKSSLTDHHGRQRYMYIDRNEEDGTYAHSIVSLPTWKKNPRGPFALPIQSWYHQTAKHPSSVSRSPYCCRHHTPPITLTSSQCVTSLSSDYSRGAEKEQITSTSLMSSASWDDQQSHRANGSTKHVYEELSDESTVSHLLLR